MMNLTKRNSITIKLMAFLLAFALLLSVANLVFSTNSTSMAASTDYYSTDGIETKAQAFENANAKNIEIMEEGIVLLKNENNALPLKANAKVNVFGKNSVNLVYGLSGSSSGGGGTRTTLYDSLDDNNIVYNDVLKTFYDTKAQSGNGRPSSPGIGSVNYGVATGETPQASYTAAVKATYAEYNDAAIVVFSRMGGEGWDLTRTMRTGQNPTAGAVNGARSAEDHYLQLDQNEADLLKALDADPTINNIIVLLNSANTMEVGFLSDPTHYAYSAKIKAALQCNLPGAQGAAAIGEILSGQVNPSGRLADTFASDFTKDPTYQNFGNNTVNGGNSSGSNFVHYDEDIYIGYRYYETRGYTDGEAWYDQSVVYPFGHGLSYTNFSWQLINQTPAQNSALTKDGTITATVRVTNTGTVAGKDVVELYYTAPYTAGGISKSHVVLGAYEKTRTLAPNESQDLTLTLRVSDMYSYDWSDANGNSFKGYELDAGAYTISIAKNAHCNTQVATNDSSTIKLNFSVPAGGFQYDKDTTTGAEVKNLFDDVSGTGKTNAAPFLGVRQYLSRDDWDGTWPTNMSVKKSTWGSQKTTSLPGDSETAPWYAATAPTQAATSGSDLKLVNMAGRDYDDPLWDTLLDNLTFAELRSLPGNGAFTTQPITSIDKKQTIDPDGPFGFAPAGSGQSSSANVNNTCAYCSPVVLAQSFNKELAYEMGETLGIEGLIGTGSRTYSGIYAPGLNTHRSQFGGRNGEYYSEDSLLAGTIAAQVVAGAKSKGVYCYMKHFMLNDQETSREGLVTWASEQAMREIYGRPFELCVKIGGCTAAMTAFNRVGTLACGQNYALLTSLLRDEWGFAGAVITDWGDGNAPIDKAMRAGCDLQLRGGPVGGAASPSSATSATNMSVLRKVAKNILYMTANSNIIQGNTPEVISTNYNCGQKVTAVSGASFNYSVAKATNKYNSSYAYSITNGTLPTGVTLTENGTFAGTPTTAGEYAVTVTAKDASKDAFCKYRSASTTYTINVVATAPTGLIYDDSTTAIAAQNVPYNYSIAKAYTMSGNNMDFSGITYSVKSGSLPAGLSLSADGKITGTPTALGNNSFTITATKGSETKDLAFSLEVKSYYVGFSAISLDDAQAGVAYTADITSGVEGNAPNIIFTLKDGSALPNGLSLSADGVISGTPTVAVANSSFTVVASSSDAASEEATFSLAVKGIVFAQQTFEATINKNATFNLVASADDSSAGITFALANGSNLPRGMTLSSSGAITGKSNTLGKYQFNVVASKDGYTDAQVTITINVVEAGGGSGKKEKGCGAISFEGTLFGIGAMLMSLVVVGFVSSKRKSTNR